MSEVSDKLRKDAIFLRANKLCVPLVADDVESIADRIDSEMVELPRDADGVSIHIGDTVCGPSGSECTVISLHLYGEEAPSWMADVNIRAYGQTVTARRGQSELTHKLPDSLARIADELDEHAKALSKKGCTVPDGMCSLSDLAVRIRRMARKEGSSDD